MSTCKPPSRQPRLDAGADGYCHHDKYYQGHVAYHDTEPQQPVDYERLWKKATMQFYAMEPEKFRKVCKQPQPIDWGAVLDELYTLATS